MAEYILVDIAQQRSKLNHVTMWRMTFYSIDDGTVWEMTVDPTYKNFKRSGWDHVVESDIPYGVYGNLKRTDRISQSKLPVVSADSKAEVIYRCVDQNEALKLMEADISQRNKKTTYGDLFNAS